MKKLFVLIIALCASAAVSAQQSITIKGRVQFTDTPDFAIKLLKREGSSMKTVAETTVDGNKQYSLTVSADKPGVYMLDCGRWQNVNLWVEDENLEIDFRGCDTAKMKIKNPPYVYINGGEKNDLMNLHNYNNYRSYQNTIAISQALYKEQGLADSIKQSLSMKLFLSNYGDQTERTRFLVRNFANISSVMALLPATRDKVLEDSVIGIIEARNPSYAPLLAYKEVERLKSESEARTAIGALAPEFSYPTPDGKKQLGPKNFKGKILVIDFWASWCGPCRAEIPSMKKIYDQFKGQGVEFLSVSIDSKQDKWKEALDDEKMAWAQVLAPNAGKELTEAYNFSGIPHIVVLDKDGRFVARGVRGTEVKDAIEKALKK